MRDYVPPGGNRSKIWQPIAAGLLIFLLAAATRLPGLASFVGPDEYYWVRCSGLFFLALASGDLTVTCQTDHPGVTLMAIESLGLAAQVAFHHLTTGPIPDLRAFLMPERMEFLSMAMLGERKFVIALFNALMVAVIAAVVWKTFDGWSALLGGILLALAPFVLAESRALHAEALLAGFGLLAALLLLIYLRSASVRHLVLAGVLAGLALLSKINGVVLVPFAGLLALAHGAARRTDNAGRLGVAAKVFAIWLVSTAATVFVLWPDLWVTPGRVYGHFSNYIGIATVGESGVDESFFMGRVSYGDPGPLFYPVVLLFRASPLTLLGAVASLVLLWRAVNAKKLPWRTAGSERERASFNVIALLVYALAYLAMMSLAAKKVDRYILPALFALNVVAGVGLAWLGRWLYQMANTKWQIPGGSRPIALAGVAVVTLLQAAIGYPHRPYYYTYYNPLLGGPPGAMQTVPVGFGEGIDRAIAYLNAKPDAADLTLLCGTNFVRCNTLFAGQTLKRDAFASEWIQADYILLYVDQMQRRLYPAGLLEYLERSGPEHVVRLHGVDYAWLYRVPEVQYFGGGDSLEGEGVLLGYTLPGTGDLDSPQVAAGESLPLRLYWENLSDGGGSQMFVRLVDERRPALSADEGYTWAEATSDPAAGFAAAARTRQAIVESEAELTVPPGTPPGVYRLRFGFYDPRREETVGEFTLPPGQGRLSVVKGEVPPSTADLSIQHPLELDMGQGVDLLGYDLSQEQAVPGQSLWLTLYWQAGGKVAPGLAVALRLLAPDGEEVASWSGEPLEGRYPIAEWESGEVVKDPWLLAVPDGTVPGTYALQVGLAGGEDWGSLGALPVVTRIPRFDVPVMLYSSGARFGDELELLGYDLEGELLGAGGKLRVTLYWRALRQPGGDYEMWVQMVNGAGQVVAGHEGPPAGGLAPTATWATGEVIEDEHEIVVQQVQPGAYRLEIGVYDPATGERLAVSGADAQGDRVVVEDLLGKIQVRLDKQQ